MHVQLEILIDFQKCEEWFRRIAENFGNNLTIQLVSSGAEPSGPSERLRCFPKFSSWHLDFSQKARADQYLKNPWLREGGFGGSVPERWRKFHFLQKIVKVYKYFNNVLTGNRTFKQPHKETNFIRKSLGNSCKT